ncbi:MAG: methyltransferase domain-containing protein [Desulfococcaceae bacterium]
MHTKKHSMKSAINFPLFLLVMLLTAALAGAGFLLTDIDTDITRYLPRHDRVISDAGYIFKHHPIQDQIVMDLSLPQENPDLLAECGNRVEQYLKESPLFRQVGMDEMQEIFPDLISHIVKNLPVLFSQRDLEKSVAPMLNSEQIRISMASLHESLLNLDGIGQTAYISEDPLGLRNSVLARMADLAPSKDIRIHKGKLISKHGKHLLLMAVPVMPGTDTAFARKLADFFDNISEKLKQEYPEAVLTPVGAYRAALDNEKIARGDVQKAIWLATLGIALLLLFAFPRPLMGLFAFVPALAGTAAAFFVFSLIYRSVSIMALGFGGAIISITVDHGIAYLLFLDRAEETSGKQAALEIRAVGLIATLTTVGAFAALCFNDFPIFEQLGLFTALGIAFSFVFVHTVFPRIFPIMPPAPSRNLPLRNVVKKLSGTGKKTAFAALIFAIVMIFFAKPDFNVSLSAMNTVSEETGAAQDLLTEVWGQQIFSKTYLMTEAEDMEVLQQKADRLLEMFEQDMDSDALHSGFVPSMIFPGKQRQQQNLTAWKNFWTQERIGNLEKNLAESSAEIGFTAEAFVPFYQILADDSLSADFADIPEQYFRLLGISQDTEKNTCRQLSGLTPGKAYDAEKFWERYSPFCHIFDSNLFSQKLGHLLFSAFIRMLVIVGISVTVLLFLFFLDLKITVIALLPVCFAMICTMGTMNLIGHSLDIPGLMLAIIVFGMGIDYSLFLVRAYQRYRDESHPCFELIRIAVFMASASTLVGFGVLCFAEHSLLKSAGLTSFLGIAYSLAGALTILPPMMRWILSEGEKENSSGDIRKRIMNRCKNADAFPRMFARFKLRLDPMFSELPDFFDAAKPPRIVLDIGCGYGVPACWMLESFPDARIIGIDPDQERTRVAAYVMGKHGEIITGSAPDIPQIPEPADTVLLLDIIHFLTDPELELSLKRIYENMENKGRLIVRAVIPPENGKYSRTWRFEALKLKIAGIASYYRSADKIREMMCEAGFDIFFSGLSGGNPESLWCIGEKAGK